MTTTTTVLNLPAQPQAMEVVHLKLPYNFSANAGAAAAGATSQSTSRRPRFKLDPMKILEPSNKKLTLPEAQRIMYIVEDLIRQLEIADYIPLLVNNESKARSLLAIHLNDEEKKKGYEGLYMSMFQHHSALIDSYGKGQKTQFSNSANSSQTRESLEMLLKSSCKDILRLFYLKPSLLDSVKSEFAKGKKPRPQIQNILNLFTDVKDMMLEKLLTTPNEQTEKIEYLKELLHREKTNNESIKKLKEEQANALADKDKEIQLRNDQIRKLDSDIKHVERFSGDLVKQTKSDAEQQEQSEIKASEGKKAKLQQELNQLKQQFATLVLEHRDQEQILRKEKWKNDTNVETILNRYDDEMSKKQVEYDEIESLYEEEKKQLRELEEKFGPLEEEYKKIMEDRRIIEMIRRMEEERLNKKIKAAIIIQSYWRGFKLRKGLKKKKGKKGKKGKKK